MSADRICYEEGLDLYQNASLEELKERAVVMRNQKNPANEVTFVIDTNPNYTNVCTADCLFCAFYRKPGKEGGYTRTLEQVRKFFTDARSLNATTVLLQGGLHPELKMDYYLEIIRMCVEEFPEIAPHFYSAPEIDNIADVCGISIEDVLQQFYDAGQKSFPGGGAEILSQKVRNRISPKKHKIERWLDIHQAAHKIGMVSTATMMYGTKETPEDVLIHLDSIRKLQDKTDGFTAFVPWSFKKDFSYLGKKIERECGAEDYFRMLAFSRIYLDNFDHIQASWFSEGKEAGVASLAYGADDFGGTLFEENVHKEAGFVNKTDANGVRAMIQEAGYTPIQRDTFYKHIISA